MAKVDVVKAPAAPFDYDGLKPEARVTVRQKTGEIRERMGKAVRSLIEVGERLIEVKETLGHGQFLRWLEAEFQWSERAARRMMEVASFCKSAKLADLNIGPSALYLLAAPSTPAEVRERFLTQAEAAPVTHRDVKAATDAAKPPKVAPVAEDEEGCSDSPEDEDFDPFEAGEGEGTPAAPPPEAPARRTGPPAVTAAPAETKGSDPQADATAGEDPEPTDEEGNPLPDDPKIREAFAAGERFDRAMSLLSQAVGEVSGLMGDGKETKASPGGQWLDSEQQSFLRDVKNARSTLKATRPYALCPYPHGGNKCEACKGLGWVVKSTWKNAPKDYHAGLKARAGKAGKEGRAA